MRTMMSLHALVPSHGLACHHVRDARTLFRIYCIRKAAGDAIEAEALKVLACTYLRMAKQAGWTIAQGFV